MSDDCFTLKINKEQKKHLKQALELYNQEVINYWFDIPNKEESKEYGKEIDVVKELLELLGGD